MKITLSLLVLFGSVMLGACGAPDASPASTTTSANVTPTLPSTPETAPIPREGKCAETNAGADACALASGRAHLWTCETADAPPKARPACMPAGGHKSWCCF